MVVSGDVDLICRQDALRLGGNSRNPAVNFELPCGHGPLESTSSTTVAFHGQAQLPPCAVSSETRQDATFSPGAQDIEAL